MPTPQLNVYAFSVHLNSQGPYETQAINIHVISDTAEQATLDVRAVLGDDLKNLSGPVETVQHAYYTGTPSAPPPTAPPPTVTSVAPTNGTVGTPVVITGTGFGATQDTSTVTFSGVASVPTAWSDTSITAPVPGGATAGGDVVVTVNGQPSAGVPFTVDAAAATATMKQHPEPGSKHPEPGSKPSSRH